MISPSPLKNGLFTLISFGLLVIISAAACSGSEDSHDDEEQAHGGETAPECQAIGDACTHGVLGALAEECHEYYHANDGSACAEHQVECVAYCLEVGEGGEGGHGGVEHGDD